MRWGFVMADSAEKYIINLLTEFFHFAFIQRNKKISWVKKPIPAFENVFKRSKSKLKFLLTIECPGCLPAGITIQIYLSESALKSKIFCLDPIHNYLIMKKINPNEFIDHVYR